MLQEFSLKVSSQELQVLVGALHDQPYKVVAQLLNKLQAQVMEQEKVAAPTGSFGVPPKEGEVPT